MHSLSKITSDDQNNRRVMEESEKLSVYYHDLFDYPLNFADLIKWNSSENLPPKDYKIPIIYQNGYYFLKGRQGLIYKRVLKNRISGKKMEIAKKAADTLSLIPAVLMVAVTGSLAMGNATDESDIDLMIITKKGTLWTTRAFAYMVIHAFGLSARKPNDSHQKDKLCLNMWMDEIDLIWKRQDRNLYTAHEIAQILPLVNKNKTYEKFLYKNRWILKYWPNAVRIKRLVDSDQRLGTKLLANYYPLITWLFEKLAFWFQYQHMKSRITREVTTPTRAIFHPQDLGRYILSRFSS